MEIIAKSNDGVIVTASLTEVKQILNAVNGAMPKEIEIGQKIPAIDYAATIQKIKALNSDYDFKSLIERSRSFMKTVESLEKVVSEAANIDKK